MPVAERDDDRIVVDTLYTERDMIKEIPGVAWDPRDKRWTLPLTWAACLQLRGVFGATLEIGEELSTWSWQEFERRVKPASEIRGKIERTNDPSFDPRLYDFQTSGAAFLTTAGSGLLGDDLGMGKTAQILASLKKVDTDQPGQALPALVICPNSVKTGWANQIAKWELDINPYIVTGSAAARRKIIEAAQKDPRAMVIINIEAIRLLSRLAPFGSVRLSRCRQCDPRHGEEKMTPTRCEVHPKILNNFGFRTVILDEAHRCKDPASKQTRAVWAVGHDKSVQRRWALTGTPVANHVGDLWAIMHFIDPAEYPTKTKFVDRYGLQAWNAFGGLDIIGINPSRKDEFFKILDPRFRRTPKALVLTQLPRIVRPVRWVNMTTKQASAYKDLEQRLITRLDNGEVLLAQNNLVNATRLLQLSSSYCDVEWVKQSLTVHDKCPCYGEGRDEHALGCALGWKVLVTLTEPSPKLDAMEEAYDELGDKHVVIAAESRQLIDLAAKRFAKRKIPYGMITGPVSEYDRQQAIQRFRDGYTKVMLMSIKAGGTGVDGLQIADTMFCLQRSWSMIENLQLDGRVDRIGSEAHNSVTIVDFVTRDSIEECVQYPRLAEKYERLEQINRDRVRLQSAGISSTATYDLDNEERLIVSSYLNSSVDLSSLRDAA